MLTALLLGGQTNHLLHREQGAGALHQLLQSLLKRPAPLRWQLVVAVRDNLGGQMKTGLLHSGQQAFAQHLEVKGEVAIEAGCQLVLLLKQQLKLARILSVQMTISKKFKKKIGLILMW